jgi:Flp pilus assembly protein TadB
VPLSENEQRILQEIEKNFYESDPEFARAVTENGYNHSGRNAKLYAAGFVACLALLLVTFSQLLIVGFAGFLGMVFCAAMFVKNLRRAIRPKLQQAERDAAIEELRNRLRNRFRHEEHDDREEGRDERDDRDGQGG